MNKEQIRGLVKGLVTDDKADLYKYSRDASIFEIKPKLVVFPKDAGDIKHLVSYVSEHKAKEPDLSLTVRAAGSCMSGGSLNDSIILDVTKNLNAIGEIHNDTIVVEPGVFFRDLEKILDEKGLMFPAYPASKSLAAIGGMIGNNAGGEKSLSYGKTEDYIEELSVILSDGNEYTFKPLTAEELEKKKQLHTFEGEIYRKTHDLIEKNYDLIHQAKPNVTKNSSGYFLWNVWDRKTFNLNKLFVGSQGTLGIITKARLRLVKPKPRSELLVMFLNDLAPLANLVNDLKPYKAETFESFDDHTMSLALRFLPGMIKKMKGNILKLAFQFLPELWMVIKGGMPKLILIAEFSGEDESSILSRLHDAQNIVEKKYKIKTRITKSPAEAQKYWTIRRESFSLLRAHAGKRQTAPFIDDFVVHPEDLPEFLPKLNQIFAKYPELIYTIAGHVGDANFHIIPLMDLNKEKERESIFALSEEVYDLVKQYKGSISGEHNDGLIRTPFLEKMYGPEVINLFKEVKNIFDPQNIFNPRKKVGATIKYDLSHIKRN